MAPVSTRARWLLVLILVLSVAWFARDYRLPMPRGASTLNQGLLTWEFRSRIDAKGVEQVWVPPGCFEMGSSLAEDLHASAVETPRHTVCISSGFWLDRFEVTNESFTRFVKDGGYLERRYWSEEGWRVHQDRPNPYPDLRQFRGSLQPKVKLSWYEAEAYAAWRGGVLPSEAQWEWAARGPESRRYPWGETFRDGLSNMDRLDLRCTVKVGSYPGGRSWCGAEDMAGNVAEWVADGWDPVAYRHAPLCDPFTPPSGRVRVLRGGSWGGITGGSPGDLRSARRVWYGAEHRKGSHGTRIATLETSSGDRQALTGACATGRAAHK
jgi:formylglycine-generating enzyme required for sulfatase activity